MIKIGEKLNSSIPSVNAAFEKNDSAFVQEIARKQLECGADYLDINTAVFLEQEIEKMLWVVENVLAVQKRAGIMLDSPNAEAVGAALAKYPLKKVIINSITLEKERVEGVLPLLQQYHTSVVALPIDDNGIPSSAEDRFAVAERLISLLRKNGVQDGQMFIDCLVQALSSDSESGVETLRFIRMLRVAYPEVHITGGLSNASFGLPKRIAINNAFMTAAVTMGLDSAIMDVTNPAALMNLQAALLVNGLDEYCGEYIETYRDLYDE